MAREKSDWGSEISAIGVILGRRQYSMPRQGQQTNSSYESPWWGDMWGDKTKKTEHPQ